MKFHDILKESIRCVLKEGATDVLYHFVPAYNFCGIVESNVIETSKDESAWNNGKNFVSFTRNGSFTNGFSIILNSGYSAGDTWCTIRLKMNVDNLRKINGVSFVPFDYMYHAYCQNPSDIRDYYGLCDDYPSDDELPHNGKEMMTYIKDSDMDKMNRYQQLASPVTHSGEYSEYFNQPYSQAEDRLLTDRESLPNAMSLIDRIDMLIYPDAFIWKEGARFWNNERKEFMELLYSNTGGIADKIHFYLGKPDLFHEIDFDYATSIIDGELNK